MDGNKDAKVTEAEHDAWIKAHPDAAKGFRGKDKKS